MSKFRDYNVISNKYYKDHGNNFKLIFIFIFLFKYFFILFR
jgi:hypothetical protein